MFMLHWIKTKKFHFLFWAVLLVYAFFATPVYNQFILNSGKPDAKAQLPLPAESKDVVFKLDILTQVGTDPQNLYGANGFAFKASDPTAQNKISVVLTSDAETLIFPTTVAPDFRMIRSYAKYKSGMDPAEFRFLISKNVLKPGIYHTGILLEAKNGSERSYVTTGGTIKMTPNTFKYTPGP
jgi:hypothetical protein